MGPFTGVLCGDTCRNGQLGGNGRPRRKLRCHAGVINGTGAVAKRRKPKRGGARELRENKVNMRKRRGNGVAAGRGSAKGKGVGEAEALAAEQILEDHEPRCCD